MQGGAEKLVEGLCKRAIRSRKAGSDDCMKALANISAKQEAAEAIPPGDIQSVVHALNAGRKDRFGQDFSLDASALVANATRYGHIADSLELKHIAALFTAAHGLEHQGGECAEPVRANVAWSVANLLAADQARRQASTSSEELSRTLSAAVKGAPSEERRRAAAHTANNLLAGGETRQGALTNELAEALAEALSAGEGREACEHVREACAQAVNVMVADVEGRERFWEVEGPRKLQEGYKLEEGEAVNGWLESTADILVGAGIFGEQ